MPADPLTSTGEIFGNSGVMTGLYRSVDWAKTPLGPVASWPPSLRSAVSICLGSRFPIAIYWGPRLVLLYNEMWSPIPGDKHPWALGRDAREVWPEIWDTIGPLFEKVTTSGEATYSEDSLLPMHRHGYTEECYFNFTFSPIRGESGEVDGVFNAVIETTYRVITERRGRVLRELPERLVAARSKEEAGEAAARALGSAPEDAPFCGVYLLDATGTAATLVGSSGLPRGSDLLPGVAPLADGPWPFGSVLASGRTAVVDLAGRPGPPLVTRPWPEPVTSAFVAPITPSPSSCAGFLVLGASPRRAVDDDYRQFVERAASSVASKLLTLATYEAERQRAEALAALDRAKTAFFSNVSHEFRTPLTLMLGPLEEALDEGDGSMSREQLEVVHRNGLRLQKLVNTLLDFARIEAGRAQASYEATDLAALTADVASTFRSAIEKAGLSLVVEARPLSEPVFVDRDMWEKVVLNLVSNAFKFTHEGSIRVALAETESAVELAVSDTGTGIPAEELPRIFERFHRVAGAKGRTHEGSGIGLALVSELVKLHQGSISVESVLDQGTTFRVTIPRGKAHLPADRVGGGRRVASTAVRADAFVGEALRWLPATESASPSSDGPRPFVLVADDNADMRDYVRRLLAGSYEVEAVPDGEAALAAIARRTPDLVLSDVMMPKLDGHALVQRLRSDPSTRSIPVILLSARAGEEAGIEGRRAGADDYLVKPFSARELVARVGGQLALARLRRESEGALRASEAALREADRRKDEFLAMLAHELRNPLAPILTAVRLLSARGPQDPPFVRARDVIGRQVEHLARLVDDLLEVSRITTGKIHLVRERVDIQSVVSRAVETSRPNIEARAHRLAVSLPDSPVRLNADPTRLAQVISNLLNNAAKYTDVGGRIWLDVEAVGAEVVVRVRDTGIGIAPDMLEGVFDLFVQADRALDRSQGGLGIGLTLVRTLVQLHGGSVRALSEGRGRGSEFVVRLPADGEAVAPTPERAAAAETARVRQRILVVDDNQDAAEMLGDLLTMYGHEVRVAFDPETAIEAAAAFSPEIVFLDIGLPRIDGFEVARRLRAAHGSSMQLVALTGYGQEEDRARSAAAGFDEHLVKPPSVEAIKDVLRRG